MPGSDKGVGRSRIIFTRTSMSSDQWSFEHETESCFKPSLTLRVDSKLTQACSPTWRVVKLDFMTTIVTMMMLTAAEALAVKMRHSQFSPENFPSSLAYSYSSTFEMILLICRTFRGILSTRFLLLAGVTSRLQLNAHQSPDGPLCRIPITVPLTFRSTPIPIPSNPLFALQSSRDKPLLFRFQTFSLRTLRSLTGHATVNF